MPLNGERLILLCRSSLGNIGHYKGFNGAKGIGGYIDPGFHSSIGFAS